MPLPSNAKPAVGTDGHLIVHQPSTDTMWEFWRAVKKADGWHAAWGGRMKDVSTNPGFYTNPSNWGSTATSLPMLGGLIRLDELQAGRIDHALALAIPEIKKDFYSWPAQRSDGSLDSANAIPEGTRFRLDPSLDLNSLQMAPVVRMIAQAAQDYGIVLRDGARLGDALRRGPDAHGHQPVRRPERLVPGQVPRHADAAVPVEPAASAADEAAGERARVRVRDPRRRAQIRERMEQERRRAHRAVRRCRDGLGRLTDRRGRHEMQPGHRHERQLHGRHLG